MREYYENEWFPKANVLGITWWQFWELNPHIIKCIANGYNEKKVEFDSMIHAWFGTYGLSAISVAVEHCLAGNKSKSKYIEKPILSEFKEKSKDNFLTEEEIDEKELKKMLLYEKQWQKQYKKKGLPETVIM